VTKVHFTAVLKKYEFFVGFKTAQQCCGREKQIVTLTSMREKRRMSKLPQARKIRDVLDTMNKQ